MGRGDKKTKKGKRVLGSYGNKRRKNRTPLFVAPVKKKAPVKTTPVEEVVDKIKEVVETKKAAPKKAAPKKVAVKKTTAKKTTAKKDEATEEKAAPKKVAKKTTAVKKAAPKKATAKKTVKADKDKEE